MADALLEWLNSAVSVSADGRYRHRLLAEKDAGRAAAISMLKALVHDAHEDARRRLRAAFSDTLDPIESGAGADPAAGYPGHLSYQTLYGYFGEVLAGVVAEVFAPFDQGWKVPAYLFRFHLVAFQELERLRQGHAAGGPLPGRTGDDCLAFQRGRESEIVATLVCEAKCVQTHHTGTIADAHEKVSQDWRVPVDLMQLIEILADRTDAESASWVSALRLLYLHGPGSWHESMNLVLYVTGNKPAGRASWISQAKAHDKYTSPRRLEAAEVHLNELKQLVSEIYGKN